MAIDIPTPWMGPYIGETIQGPRTPVFFDPHTAIATNNPPGVFISGSPGSGKTFTAMTLCYQSVIEGKTTVYLDPKADAQNILSLQKDMGEVSSWDLANDKQTEPGMLSPFTIESDPAAQRTLAMSLIETFTGGLSAPQKNALTDILEDVTNKKRPSLDLVMQKLMSARGNPEVNAVGSQLRLIQPTKFANLCFGYYEGNRMKISNGLTIITMLGMNLPQPNVNPKTLQLSDRVALGIMLLITTYIRNIMVSSEESKPDQLKIHRRPKTIIIDESWAILSNAMGLKVIKDLVTLGRSLNTVCILISQNADDVGKYQLSNSISTRFAFKVKDPEEAIRVRDSFNLPSDAGIETTLTEFQKGDCLMKDLNGHVACVHIDAYDQRLIDAFNTNPFADNKG